MESNKGFNYILNKDINKTNELNKNKNLSIEPKSNIINYKGIDKEEIDNNDNNIDNFNKKEDILIPENKTFFNYL